MTTIQIPNGTSTVMEFTINADKTKFTGRMTCDDDDGTTTLAMMLHSALKKGSDQHKEMREAKSMKITARIIK